MEGFKEFQGKTLDDAISEACAYFDTAREKLEIDIVQDAKSGIFGLVGARKAKVRARRVQMRSAMDGILGRGREEDASEQTPAPCVAEKARKEPQEAPKEKPEAAPREEKSRPRGRERQDVRTPEATEAAPAQQIQQPRQNPQPQHEDEGGEAQPSSRPERNRGRGGKAEETSGRRKRTGRRPGSDEPLEQERNAGRRERPESDEQDDADDLQRIPFEDLDQERLRALSLEAVSRLVEPIVGPLPMQVELEEGRVCVRLDCGDDSGLLIGREGQTLAALQYLASRLVSRGMNAAVRVQLDAGEYRLRQDEKLREMALALAEKVRASGKSLSTRPLSSYHRRIVHVALQEQTDVQTRSSGEGALKRVIIQRKRG